MFNFGITVLDLTKTIYDRGPGGRRLRRGADGGAGGGAGADGGRDYGYLNSESGRPQFMAAGMEIVNDMQPEMPVVVPPQMRDWPIQYARQTEPSRALVGSLLPHNHRHRRAVDGAWHFQKTVDIVANVPVAAAPQLAVTSDAHMCVAWNYLDSTKQAPFGHGISMSRLVDGQWDTSITGLDVDTDLVASGASLSVLPGTTTYLVAFTRVVLPPAVLKEPKLGNAAGAEVFVATQAATGAGTLASQAVRLTTNNVADGDPQLHTDGKTYTVLTFLRQATNNIEDPDFTVVLRHWNNATSSFGAEQAVATGTFTGPVRYVEYGGASGTNPSLCVCVCLACCRCL